MRIEELSRALEPSIGEAIHTLISELYPICRSITGEGVRTTLRRIREEIPLEIHEVPTGTPVFDWTIPKEWNIRDAYIKDPAGSKVVDFKKCNLHVLNYSIPIHKKMPLGELREHLFTLPEQPDLIPYRTSYYRENWGFCLTHNQLLSLKEGEYEACIDSTLASGHLSYGELLIPGKDPREFLISCHSCHPSLANDGLSGVGVSVHLAKSLLQAEPNFSYRFVFIPGTIGSITYLAINEQRVDRIQHGLVLSCIGDPGPFHYKKSRGGSALIDRAAQHVMKGLSGSRIIEFEPYGYDERQYCSPAFDLPVGCLSRTPYGRFPEYHTSADNLTLVKPDSLAESLRVCLSIVNVIENNRTYRSLNPRCEPNLGRRGLYRMMGGLKEAPGEKSLLWVLNQSDGRNDLLAIAEKSGMNFDSIKSAADALISCSLLEEVEARRVERDRST